MVTIVRQPRWSFGTYTEIYRFPVPDRPDALWPAVESFYRERGASRFVPDTDRLGFSRGHLIGSLFSPNERHHKQSVVVRLTGPRRDRHLECEYRCLSPYPEFHFATRNLFVEVQNLEAQVGDPGRRGPGTEKRARPALWPGVGIAFRLFYRLYRVVSWARYRIPRRLTPAGLAVLGGLSIAALTGLDTENTVAYQAFNLLLFLLALAAPFLFVFRTRFAATRLLPRFGTAGQTFSYRVVLRNLTARPQQGLTLLEDLADPRPSYPEWLVVQLADERRLRSFRFGQRRHPNPFRVSKVREAIVPPVMPRQETEARVELTPLRRGILRFRGVSLARTDPLGLVRSFRRVALPQSMLILPRRYPLPPVALPGTTKYQEGGVAFASNVGQSEEFVALRDYRRGDPVRHIHWRSWAKAGKPIVKEFEDEFFVRHALVLDTFIDDPRSELFEEAVSVAASFACTVLTQESLLDLLFVGPQAYCFTAGRGLAHTDQMLEILASVRACTDKPFRTLEALLLDHVAGVSGCICVLLDWDGPRQDLVRKLKVLGVPVLVLVLTEPGRRHPLDPGPLRDEPQRLHALELGRIEHDLANLK